MLRRRKAERWRGAAACQAVVNCTGFIGGPGTRLKRLAAAQQPDDVMRKYRLAFAEEAGVAWGMGITYNARHGIPTEDVAAFRRGRTAAP